MDLAGRYDRYNTYGSSVTPKFGVKYSPFKMLTLRGTYGKGFRAPNPAEAGQSGELFGGAPFNDATLCPNPANPNAAGNFPTQCNRGLIGLQVSNPQLQPEKSTQLDGGHHPHAAGQHQHLVRLLGHQGQPGHTVRRQRACSWAVATWRCFPSCVAPPVNLPFCITTGNCTTQALTRSATVLYQAFPYLNLTQTHVNGLDMDLISHFDIGTAGRLTAQPELLAHVPLHLRPGGRSG